MARKITVSLGEFFSSFIDELVRSGRYGSASEVMHTGLRLLQEHEAQIELELLPMQEARMLLQDLLAARVRDGLEGKTSAFGVEEILNEELAGIKERGLPG